MLSLKRTEANALSLNISITELIHAKANEIMAIVMKFHRTSCMQRANYNLSCDACYLPHLPKIIYSIIQGKPISFILPAFPGKSPNLSKVIGTLPDMAERHSLNFLNNLCESIKKIYSPGAHIVICSDGRVFSDLIGIKEKDINAYQQELDLIINKCDFNNLSTFNLDQLYNGDNFQDMRNNLLQIFGEPIDVLQQKVHLGFKEQAPREEREAHRMYCGITKFLFEDQLYPGQLKSKTALQKDARKRAYGVIQRSNAWSKLLAKRFPEHVRLSIHPQTCGDVKIGINLLPENFMTRGTELL